MGQKTQTAAEDQRIIRISWMIEDRAIDRRNTHLIAIVANTINDATGDTPWCQYALRQFIGWCAQWAKAKHIGGGDGLSGDTNNVTNNAADASVGTTKRLDG